MYFSKLLACFVAMARPIMSETNVWLYNLPNYQGAVYEYDGSQYGCQTIGEVVYENVQSAKIVHFEPYPCFVCTLFYTNDCQLGSRLFNISADGRDIPLAPNFGARSIECETWEP
ncbi:hypothetical protein J3E69DRAFT_326143 [Trichoderma sp. SZMC 28015]